MTWRRLWGQLRCKLRGRHRLWYRFAGARGCSRRGEADGMDCSISVYDLWCDTCGLAATIGEYEAIDWLARKAPDVEQ